MYIQGKLTLIEHLIFYNYYFLLLNEIEFSLTNIYPNILNNKM